MDFRLYLLALAPFIGSFLGVLIIRLPAGIPLAWTRSVCSCCGRQLGVRDLVPIFSYLLLRGKCRYCDAEYGRFHLWVELAALAVAASAAAVATDPLWLLADCLLGWGLLALGWIDARTMLLPDVLTLPLLLAGLGMTFWLAPDDLFGHALAAMVGYAAFEILALTYRRLRGREGLGGGDAKLMGVAGAWLGLEALPWVVLLAAVSGLLAILWRSLRGGDISRTTAVAFGPYLAAAIWALRLFGAEG